jgi:hypothetical protein
MHLNSDGGYCYVATCNHLGYKNHFIHLSKKV